MNIRNLIVCLGIGVVSFQANCLYAVDFDSIPALARWLKPVKSVPAVAYSSDSFVKGVVGQKTGFFHVEQIDGKWWGIDPLGRGFVFCGVQSANYRGVYSEFTKRANYKNWNDAHGGHGPWRKRTLQRLKGWGFNFLGQGCEGSLEHAGLCHAHQIAMGRHFADDDGPAEYAIAHSGGSDCRSMPDMFHPDFPAWCRIFCERRVAPYRDDPWTVGWFIDNELSWRGTGDLVNGFFDQVAALPDSRPAKKALVAFLAGRKPTHELKNAFSLMAARKYFEVTSAAIRAADPNHMVLGCRFAGLYSAGDPAWKAAGEFCDVVSVNIYPWTDPERNLISEARGNSELMREVLAARQALCGKPMMVTEWSFRALDTGHPNTCGAGQVFRTQAERTHAVEMFLPELFSDPSVVGHVFFRWVDQPPEGIRPQNGEDGNYGLVSEHDEPYPLTEVFTRVHADLKALKESKPLKARPRPADTIDMNAVLNKKMAAPIRAVDRVKDGRYHLENGAGFRLAGSVGSKWLFSDVRLVSREMGRIRFVVCRQVGEDRNWMSTTNTVCAASRKNDDGSVEMQLEAIGGDKKCAFSAKFIFTVWPGRNWARMRLLEVTNTGKTPFLWDRCYFHQIAAFEPLENAIKPTRTFWNGPVAAGWLAEDGRWEAAVSYVDGSHFYYALLGEKKIQHPDAAFYPEKMFTLAAGETYRPEVKPEAFLLYGVGGIGEWKSILKDL